MEEKRAHKIKRIVKWGGAAITHKHGALESPNMDVIQAAARHISEALKTAQSACGTSPNATVIVHGAGSFGHPQAVQHGVAQGWHGKDAQGAVVRQGFALTRASVLKLNGLVVDALVNEGLPAVGLSPFSCGWVTCGRRVVQDGCAAVMACLAAGLLPVLHGDCVLDDELGCTILSGDTIMRRLAEVLGSQEVVFLTNVAGVYDRPPEEPKASLLRHILVHPDASWQVPGVILTSSALDATGGIAKKVDEAVAIAALGVDVVIAQAGTEDGRLACLLTSKELELLNEQRVVNPSPQHQPGSSVCNVSPTPESADVSCHVLGAAVVPRLGSCDAHAVDAEPEGPSGWRGTIVRLIV